MKKLLEGLHRFQSGYFSSHKELFEQLAHGQHPRILFITCADSRIDPNLITQADIGELFVIRNAGNIIPPYGSANGGEGASIEYALDALGIEQIVVCGHSHCGAMKGLLNMNSLEEKMPLVHSWLKHAEATRRLVKENYSEFLEGEDLLEITIAENVLNQLSNLQTYPSVRSKQHQQKLSLHGWIYRIETGEVLAYDPLLHDFVAPHSRLLTCPEPEYVLHPSVRLHNYAPFTVPEMSPPSVSKKTPVSASVASEGNGHSEGYSHLPPEQADRIYRGSNS
ncbi:MAG: carbonic anhydrase [Hydrococcus sp. Prado102]|jgi:carbonic anhydrase|nr:carbonic anhydrase [Hydrococcus sp. Prado102]